MFTAARPEVVAKILSEKRASAKEVEQKYLDMLTEKGVSSFIIIHTKSYHYKH